ncbi:hypothetical protein CFP56_025181 [Quercus suber]|uniref:Reverse transcriptase zinc-binding domain-containing protein n=1 Tax=Quercus suber TaxID=58331 RepID=A0AAW0K5A9_QUESU
MRVKVLGRAVTKSKYGNNAIPLFTCPSLGTLLRKLLDHRPILLSLDVGGEHKKWNRKPFRFEAMWVSDSGCCDVITRAWDCTPDGTPMFVTKSKLKRCKQSLKLWSREHFGNVKKRIKDLKDRLWRAEDDSASAYHFLVAAEDCLAPSSSSLPNGHAIWKKKVPNKIRHFIWRAMKDSLPTKVNLKARYVPVDDVCEGCGDYSELTMHSLWLCDQAWAVWMSGPEFQFLIRKGCRMFIELLEHLFKEGSGLQVAVFATICWCLCERWNRMRVRQTSWQIHKIEGRVRMMVKLDCAGLGVVYQDHSGQVIAALSQKIGLPHTVEMAEALATRQAVEFARELSPFDVILEGDCLQVVRALNASGGCNTLYGHILPSCNKMRELQINELHSSEENT